MPDGRRKARAAAAAREAEDNLLDSTELEKKTDGQACTSCRKRKAKCTRVQPCSQCEKYGVECTYDETKLKPGIRTGAIENLSRRIDALENMFLGQGVLWEQVWARLNVTNDSSTSDLKNLSSTGSETSDRTLDRVSTQLRGTFSELAAKRGLAEDGHHNCSHKSDRSAKRARFEKHTSQHDAVPDAWNTVWDDSEAPKLPVDLEDALVEKYFSLVHHWIPMLHVRLFRDSLAIPSERRRLVTIIDAITSVCCRFSNDPRLGDATARAKLARRNRERVLLKCLESFSVENLQALIICAFDTIGSGRGPSAWSIVGTMTRTVEQLQLSVEDQGQAEDSEYATTLIKRMAFLQPSQDWAELEERRRVFWNVFLMDRFCSLTTGCNVSLTSADVKRRLPCEGALWEAGEPLKTSTPHFGVSDKSNNSSSALPSLRQETADQTSMGGFAYCIEATENLSLVTSFFLQPAIDLNMARDMQMWMLRFKQLDLRLMQWKLSLPAKWREACAVNADGIMDPNLTLAHITHNTAVVLLHQVIAYSSSFDWRNAPVTLPSASSADTCVAAATEVAIIAVRFLQESPILTNPQFSFCLFICGRMLLAHAKYCNVLLSDELRSLTDSLWEIARRWNGDWPTRNDNGSPVENLASKFAARLAQASSNSYASLDISCPAFSEDSSSKPADLQSSSMNDETSPRGVYSTMPNAARLSNMGLPEDQTDQMFHFLEASNGSPDSISLAFPPLPLSFQPQSLQNINARPGPLHLGSASQQDLQSVLDRNRSDMQEAEGMAFADFGSYLSESFPSNERISVFSKALNEESSI